MTTTLAVLSPLLTVSRSVPQATRVVRRGAEGVSAWTWTMILVLGELWTVYGFLARVPAEVATNLPNSGLTLFILMVVARQRGAVKALLTGLVAVNIALAGFVVGCVLSHANGIESAAAVGGSFGLYVPQLLKSIRENDFTGVSAPSWILAFFAAVSWGAYGLAINKVPVYLPSVLLVPTSLGILIRTSLSHHRPVFWHGRVHGNTMGRRVSRKCTLSGGAYKDGADC